MNNLHAPRLSDLSNPAFEQAIDPAIADLLQPETALEKWLLSDPVIVEGLHWGVPRFGHPEGKVLYHIREVLDNIDKLTIDAETRTQLRLIAIIHDTFKYQEDRSNPRDWQRHHGVLARRYFERFYDDLATLDVIELHDEAYYIWIEKFYHQRPETGALRLRRFLDRIGENLQLYYLFFKCDTRTGDKNQTPLKWFERAVSGISVVHF